MLRACLRGCGEQGYHCDLDNSSKTLQKKIRDNQLAQYNFILVVGKEEVENKTVNVRTRDNQVPCLARPYISSDAVQSHEPT